MRTDPRFALPQPRLLEQIGRGLKRVRGADERPDSRGYRTIWHHGPMKTDLFSYLGPDRSLVRQELVFMGRAIQWDARDGLSTGEADEGAAPSAPASTPVAYADGQPADLRVLMEASLLLRAYREEDFYVSHLRKQLNDVLRASGTPATVIEGLDEAARRELERLYEISQEIVALPHHEAPPRSRSTSPLWFLVAGLLIGAAVALYLIVG